MPLYTYWSCVLRSFAISRCVWIMFVSNHRFRFAAPPDALV